MPGPPLVTGATGFAGSHLVHLLLAREPRLAAWGHTGGRSLPGSRDERVSWAQVDLLDANGVTAALEQLRPSAIFHLAGMADVHAAWRSAAPALRINALGTHHLLEALRKLRLDIPVLVTGSALVYRPSSRAIDEDSPLVPASPYGVSKLAQEMMALGATWCRVFVARPFNHAGPGQSDAYVTSSFARQIAEIEAGLREPVLHVGNLESRRDITDVRDTVRAYELILSRGTPRRPYNVCCGKAYRIADLMRTLVSSARVEIQIQTDPGRLRPSDTPVVLGSFAQLERDTGWRPAIPIEQTLSDLLDYWRAITVSRVAR
ncbi:MAG: GDP-mannose 4,6-dehydratase [Vicinamibacterales bacterium]